jgi:hypothetical protein
MNSPVPCPICGEGHVTAQVQMVESEYKGHKANLLCISSCVTFVRQTLPVQLSQK